MLAALSAFLRKAVAEEEIRNDHSEVVSDEHTYLRAEGIVGVCEILAEAGQRGEHTDDQERTSSREATTAHDQLEHAVEVEEAAQNIREWEQSCIRRNQTIAVVIEAADGA